VGLAKIAGRDGAIDRGHNLGQGDRLGGAREHVSTADSTFRADESDPLQTEENLLEIGLGQSRAFSEVANRRGRTVIIA
jgi:hypothetical protein